jgi:hypothetical protein
MCFPQKKIKTIESCKIDQDDMAAFRRLLLRGLLAGRRAAMAPAQAPRAFSTTSTTGGSHFPQVCITSHHVPWF